MYVQQDILLKAYVIECGRRHSLKRNIMTLGAAAEEHAHRDPSRVSPCLPSNNEEAEVRRRAPSLLPSLSENLSLPPSPSLPLPLPLTPRSRLPARTCVRRCSALPAGVRAARTARTSSDPRAILKAAFF
jgi:hypothetical protein